MTSANPSNPLQNAFRNPNFRLLWAGQATSILGDQFSMIAMPWLVLKLTGSDPVALGTAPTDRSFPSPSPPRRAADPSHPANR